MRYWRIDFQPRSILDSLHCLVRMLTVMSLMMSTFMIPTVMSLIVKVDGLPSRITSFTPLEAGKLLML